MADIITTEYDDDSGNDFIQCEYCDKSIRGDTQYRIHLTTNQHLKKRESMNLKDDMPIWENFLDYLDYLKLDEPIIGLNSLEQLESQVLSNGQFRLKYKCRMCNLEADLPAMASHVVGRKHRQKFMESHRPDLVTWDNYSINQQGKVIRAKAEVVERQEGRGLPMDLRPKQRNSRWNGPQRGSATPNPRFQDQRQNMRPKQRGLDQGHLRYDPPGMDIPLQDFPEDPHYQEKPVDENYFLARAYRKGADYPEDAPYQRNYPEEDDRFKLSLPESDEYQQRYSRDNHHEEPYQEGRRGPFPDKPPRQAYGKGDHYEPSYYENDHQGRPQPGDDRQHLYVDDHHSAQRYPVEDPPRHVYKESPARAFKEEESPRQLTDYNHGERFYSERDSSGYSYPQVDHRQLSPVSEVYGQAYPEEHVHDRCAQEDMDRGPYSHPYSKGESSEWHPKADTDRRFQGRNGSGHYNERGIGPHKSQDYRREKSYSGFDTERNREDEVRYGGEMPESRMDRDQAEARMPRLRARETGSMFSHHESTRKRRSRFSDCTEAEKELLQKYQMAQAVSQKLVRSPPMKVQKRSESGRLRENHREHGGAQQDPGNVVDFLKGVQIESVEEANFLKNKLCSLLKEFQANKSGVRGAPPTGSRDYEEPRSEIQERPRSEEYSYQMREMVATERDHEMREPPVSGDYGYRSREMSSAERGYDKMQKKPLHDEYSYRMREMSTAGRDQQERPPSDDYKYHRREMMEVGHGPDDFRQVSTERFDRRSYEREQSWHREVSRPAEDFPRDDLNRGEYRSSPQDNSFRIREGSQQSYYDGPFEKDPRDFHPHPVRTHFDEERRNPPSNLDKIASTLLQLVAHK